MAAVEVQRRLFTVEDYYKMADAGIIKPDDRVELINGEIIRMSPIKSFHASVVDILVEQLILKVHHQAIVRAQNPIQLDDLSEPEPDIVLAKQQANRYSQHHPRPTDILLIIEVADSSLNYDRGVKSALYAKAGIPEYWIMNLQEQQVEVYRTPQDDGYAEQEAFAKTATVSCQTIEVTLNLPDVFDL